MFTLNQYTRRSIDRIRQIIRPLTVWLDNQVPAGRRRRRRELRLYAALVRPGDLCFDIGAHVGNTTATLLALGARVVSVEPQARCVRILHHRFGHRLDVAIVHAAVAEEQGSANLWISEENDAVATLSEQWIAVVKRSGRLRGFDWTKTERVPVVTLEDLIHLKGVPVVCKIDVEGSELRVIKGLRRPLRYVVFEFHRETLDLAKECVGHLASTWDAAFNYAPVETAQLDLASWVSAPDIVRHLAAQPALAWGDVFAACSSPPLAGDG